MKLAYQISTWDVAPDCNITSWHGALDDCFRRLWKCGYDGAELMVCDPASIDAEELLRLMETYGLEVPMVCTGEIGGMGLTFSDPDDAIRAEALSRAEKAVDLAAAIGAQVNIGRIRGQRVPGAEARSRRRSMEALRELCGYAWKCGVRVALEPINSIVTNFINTTLEGLQAVEELNSPAACLMLDVQHMYLDDADIFSSIRDAQEHFSYVHVMDSNRLYPGTGNRLLDLPAFVGALKESGYDGYLGVEIFQRPNQEVALEQSAYYFKKLLGQP